MIGNQVLNKYALAGLLFMALWGATAFAAPAPTFSATTSGTTSNLTLTAILSIGDADVGQDGNVYLAATVGSAVFLHNGASFVLWSGGPLPVFSVERLANRSIEVVRNANLSTLVGTQIYVGYGLSESDMLTNGKFGLVYTVLSPTLNTADPLYQDQWHLKNTGQLGATGIAGTPGEDVNVEPVWLAATPRMGSGIRIAVVDDGLEIAHEDLAANVAAGLSRNYLTGSTDPTERRDDTSQGNGHGTSVAGIAAARDNGFGGRGAAPRANLVGYNMLQDSTASNEADAMTRGSPNVHISNNSWGSPDGFGTLDASSAAWRTAINTGLTNGRGGRGTIYTWAAGNGAPDDNSNYDGYANNRGVIAVAAVNDRGIKASYSELGANLWISAPGGEDCDTHTITTTDRTGSLGSNTTGAAPDYANTNYTQCMNGTSAATPVVSGVVALMLEARPTLGWRDVRLILAQSARKNDAADAGWTTSATTPAYNFNHKYGFGVANAEAAVNLASSWSNVGTEVTHTTALASPGVAIPDNNATGVSSTIAVASSGITRIEFIEITFSAANHTYSGDLEIRLTSPAGATVFSRLSEDHTCDPCTPYNAWVFGSARHLGEAANGNWTLTVKDLSAVDTGIFQSWRLKFYGR